MPGVASAVLNAALSQLGVKYAWGGESPGKDFDCSGSTQWAYSQAGVSIPRTSQEQFSSSSRVDASGAKPGDLVFMAGSDGTAQAPGHVGIYLGAGQYIDSPYTGVDVRVDPVPTGASYGHVSSLVSDVTKPVSGQAGSQATATASVGAGSGVGCSAKQGGLSIPLVNVTIGSACQMKALTGGLLIGLGGTVLLVGAVLIAAHGLGHTALGQSAVGSVPQNLPGIVGAVAKVVK